MKKILVIEDNNDVRENICEILELANYKTIQAENGKIGVEQAKLNKPDLIICDVMMPILDGFGVLRILNRDAQLMHIPFMFLTAKSEKTDFRKGMGLGADDYITKPFDEVELMDAIEMRLKKSENIAKISNSVSGINSLFSEIKADHAITSLSNKEHRTYNTKSIIYEIDQYPKYLYYLVRGTVKTTQLSETGKELILNVYGPGDFIGLVALIQDASYNETAICNEPTELLLIPADEFRKIMVNDRNLSAKFIQLLAHHASHSESQLIDLAFSSVRKKVSKAILSFAKKKDTLKLQIGREDLAALAGTTRESVIRTLADFKNEGLVSINKGTIIILDKKRLLNLPQ